MRSLLTIIILSTLVSCSNQESVKINEDPKLSQDLMVGEWRLDSSSNRYQFNDRLIVLEDLKTFEFSGTDGGSLRTIGNIEYDSLKTELGETLRIELLDSNRLRISGGWSNSDDYFKRSNYGNYQDNLLEYLQQDSLRQKVIGWWQLTKSKMPVKLINYSGYYEKFTLNIQENGDATFYLENQFDSLVNYSYRMNPDGMDFNRGCIVGSDYKIFFDKAGNMKLILDKRFGDTLTLERLKEIKK
ncbi:hypothetical protein R5N98_04860 [Tenacibaculum maritimum]|uniref:hypothetical protein n=1 Tax=Tenacibaculum maritimum TaxID=107401 RepID=UPI003876C90A